MFIMQLHLRARVMQFLPMSILSLDSVCNMLNSTLIPLKLMGMSDKMFYKKSTMALDSTVFRQIIVKQPVTDLALDYVCWYIVQKVWGLPVITTRTGRLKGIGN